MAHPIHTIAPQLLQRRVRVHLAGVGGNGAQMVACLARLDIALRAFGHPYGLMVHAFDPDLVSEANVGRQLYSPADVGYAKALVTITRLNHFYGLDWEAQPRRIEDYWETRKGYYGDVGDILISCVDTRAARRIIHQHLFGPCRYGYWLDLGNRAHDGQVVLGEPGRSDKAGRLPCVTERYPELIDCSIAEDEQPSCSVRLSLASQGLFINDLVVRYAAQLLYELFTHGELTQAGVVCSLHHKRSAPLALPDVE